MEAVSVTDFSGLAKLRYKAQTEQSSALREVAEQFEALFMQMMLKSMRNAKLGEGLFDSPQSDQYRDMLDTQLSMNLSQGRGLGLADVIVRQLGGDASLPPTSGIRGRSLPPVTTPRHVLREAGQVVPAATREAPASERSAVAAADSAGTEPDDDYTASPAQFVRAILPYAREAAARLGLGPEILVAQTALETGWGQGVIRDPQGDSSHNLFNIKADGRWNGPVVVKNTLEYVDGVAVQERARFRRYDSPVESFKDYVAFLQSSPRYREALQHDGDPHRFIEGLQRAGYATDPDYATKINGILDRAVITGERVRVKGSDSAPIAPSRISL